MRHIKKPDYIFSKRDRRKREKHFPNESDLKELVDIKIKKENWSLSENAWNNNGRVLHDLIPLAAEVLPDYITAGGLVVSDGEDPYPDPSHEVSPNEVEHFLVRKTANGNTPLCKSRILLSEGSFVTSIASSNSHIFLAQFDPHSNDTLVTAVPLPAFTKPSLSSQTIPELGVTIQCEGCVVKMLQIDQGLAVATTDGCIRLVSLGIISSTIT
eukprot:TRINITY_DN6835_c0_g1_i1.p1 TRINITY_DN6835_c0_g1~~TRINITY_DN6835_c0_g1_i1.p1  ORF type:complete len:213 (+),score=28.89 TRINITY_DN6835_c0_g1_i1:896-1534(+)